MRTSPSPSRTEPNNPCRGSISGSDDSRETGKRPFRSNNTSTWFALSRRNNSTSCAPLLLRRYSSSIRRPSATEMLRCNRVMSCKSVSDASTAFSPSCFHNTGAENQGREEELPAYSQTLAEECVWSQACKGSPNEKRGSISGGINKPAEQLVLRVRCH